MYKLKKQIMLLYLFHLVFCNANLSEPYNSIEVLPFNKHSFFGNQKNLKELLEKYKPKTIIEVGVWLGHSTAFMAQHIAKGSKIYAVDTWLGSPEHHFIKEWNALLSNLYQQFLSNIIHLKLTDKIIPVRMKSLEAAKALKINADFIYIDAAHDEESVYNDVIFWYKKLNIQGIMCGDDWGGISVQTGVKKAANELNKKINVEGGFWWFDPKLAS